MINIDTYGALSMTQHKDLLNISCSIFKIFAMAIVLLQALDSQAQAMGRASCQNYARKAVAEFYQASRAPECGEHSGPRWHNDFTAHFNWCLSSSIDSIRSETDARQKVLKACTSRHVRIPL
jgi:hypothetical protein